jgi:hypothetical protein
VLGTQGLKSNNLDLEELMVYREIQTDKQIIWWCRSYHGGIGNRFSEINPALYR